MAAWSEYWSHYAPHSAYVVGAYAVSAVGVAWLILDTLLRAQRWKSKAAERNDPR